MADNTELKKMYESIHDNAEDIDYVVVTYRDNPTNFLDEKWHVQESIQTAIRGLKSKACNIIRITNGSRVLYEAV